MFDFGLGAPEIMLVVVAAIIVVGPKDLPRLLRSIGQFVSKIKSMAREFQGHLEDAARETGVDDIKDDLNKMSDFDLDADFEDQANDLKKSFENAGPDLDDDDEKPTGPASIAPDSVKAVKDVAPAKKTRKPAAAKTAKKRPAKKSVRRKTTGKKPARQTAKT